MVSPGKSEQAGSSAGIRPQSAYDPFDLPPPDVYDPVIEAYKKDVDRTLLRENLKLTPEERSRKFEESMRLVFELRRSARERWARSTRTQ